ncbi:MAG: glycosyltransferase family 1 protein [Alphaproteobacteria bacterium]|nr:glycosyltransferase family 1 protein [Alphaproteobacteria bacterium]
MKILIITDAWHPQVNGVVRTYEHLTEGLRNRGHCVDVIAPGDFPLTLALPGYGEIRLVLFPYEGLGRKIKRFNPDHIHIATEGPLGWAARRYCILHKQDFTTSYHTHFPDYAAKRLGGELFPFLYEPICALARSIVRRFHAPSRTMMIATASLENHLKEMAFATPMRQLTRGIDRDLFYPGEKTLFSDLKPPIALYVGRVAIEKNLEAFLSMPWPGTKVIVGDGPRLKRLQRQYPQAVFTGKKTGQELADHYRSADVFVFPSRTDTFGIVLIEALACGLPIAAFPVTGPVDIITHDFLGAMHPDDLSLAAQHALVTGTPEQRANYVHDHYSWDLACQQFEEIVMQIR